VSEGQIRSVEVIAEQVRAALSTRDLSLLHPLLADDAQFGSCVGRGQVIDWMEGALADGRDVVVSDVASFPDRIVLELRVGGEPIYQVLLIRDGTITEVRGASDPDDARVVGPTSSPLRPSGPLTGIRSLAMVFPVRDLSRALEHYRRLGFAVQIYEHGGYGYAERGSASLHLNEISELDHRTNTSVVYLHVDDADALYAEWRSSGVTGQFFEPEDTDYGLREAAHIDRDGNVIRFGSPLSDSGPQHRRKVAAVDDHDVVEREPPGQRL
jgi:uncharacterized glyoxalase superfamily protein PhnB